MNDKDKEAFEKWWMDGFNGMSDREVAIFVNVGKQTSLHGWQASCEYKQKEIDELNFRFTLESNLIGIITSENQKLQAELLEYKEAASSEAALVNELQAENAKLRECVEFYAEKGHWGIAKPSDSVSIDPCDHYGPYETETSISNAIIGGKRARQVLKELNNYEFIGFI